MTDEERKVAQSDAEPVTVYAITHALRHFERIIWDAGRWSNECQEKLKAALRQIDAFVDQSDAGPRPDASAGLIEALQQIIDNCDDNSAPQCRHDLALKFVREIALKALRARAADRSWQ